MTKEQLAAEIAALRELLTVIGQAGLPQPADGERNYAEYLRECRDRLAAVAIITRCAMDYTGQAAFTNILRNSAGSLRKELARPLPYTPETAEREPVGGAA